MDAWNRFRHEVILLSNTKKSNLSCNGLFLILGIIRHKDGFKLIASTIMLMRAPIKLCTAHLIKSNARLCKKFNACELNRGSHLIHLRYLPKVPGTFSKNYEKS